MTNPNRDAYLDSFQGKDQSALDDLPESTVRDLRRRGFIIDGTGSSDPNSLDYNPRKDQIVRRGTPSPRPYANSQENRKRYLAGKPLLANPEPPAPEVFPPPPPEPIKVKSAEPVLGFDPDQDEQDDINEGFARERDRIRSGSTGAYGEGIYDVSGNNDKGTTGRSVSNDAPEVYYGPDDEYEEDFPLDSEETADGSETGADKYTPGADTEATTKISQAQDASAQTSGAFMEDLSNVQIDARPNELNVFSSYTYNLALYMMNSDSYVDITSSPSSPQDALTPPNSFLLMRSGGTGVENANTDFNNDFFIDDLEISNVAVGPSKFKQNTNVTDIRFTITEPRGVTLLEKLQRLAGQVLANTGEKYIHAPYLLEIKFKGYDELGNPMPAPSLPKYIPIRITDMQFEVSTGGAQYKVTAIPYAAYTLGSVVSTIPMNIELKASKVGDIFTNVLQTVREEPVRESYTAGGIDPGLARAVEGQTGKKPTKTVKESVKNLGQLLTDYQIRRTAVTTVSKEKSLEVKDTQVPAMAEFYDTYDFQIAKEIAESKLNIDGLYDALNTPAPTEGNKEKENSADVSQFDAYVQSISGGVTLDKATSMFKINAGTDISKLINLIIMHSDYMDRNVMENPPLEATSGNPINWFKIRPVIKSARGPGTGFDKKDGRYKYQITFNVEKNNIYYSDFPWAKKSKPVGQGFHKRYDYIFTGRNTEVLDFGLKFNTAFIQVMTAGTGNPSANKDGNSFAPVVKELPKSVEGDTINGANTLTRSRAKDLFSSVMHDGVDLIDLNLQIVGDPAWIPTSDAYWQDKIRQGQTYTEAFMPDGTINYNVSSPYLQVNLRTPVDYDETTGLANPAQFGNSQFSGIYQVTSCDSTFSGGVFQQRLEGFRTHLQPTSNGVERDESQVAGKERGATVAETAASEDAYANVPKPLYDDEIFRRSRRSGSVAKVNSTPVQSGGAYGEFGVGSIPNADAYDDYNLGRFGEHSTRVENRPGVVVEFVDEVPGENTDEFLL